MTKLFLIFHGRFPSEKAASLFAAKSAESFASEKVNVTLIVPRRIGRQKDDAYVYYGISRNFNINYVPVIDLFFISHVPKIAFFVSYISFSISTLIFLTFKAKDDDVVYSNEWMPIFLASFLFKRTLYELHDFPESVHWFFRRFFRRVKYILAHNRWKKEKLVQNFNVPDNKIICLPNAVDIKQFDLSLSKEDARIRLGLDHSKRIVVYTGHLYSWKGVDTLAEAAKFLPDNSLIIFVGGTEKDITLFKERFGSDPRIFVAGHKKHDEIPVWQKVADVLVIPNTAKEKISAFYTSPMKLFEYMASSRPIIASNIPSIREIVDQSCVLLVEPDDPRALATGIKKVFDDPLFGDRLASKALESVQSFTWVSRAKAILSFIS